ncbi:alpha/beta hydrolase [Candidatus Leptofilum sp.]|uniref:alpha/beta hydrolase n=1 Tax=Candidatus Leptofilum sp. TaxID=3241576 RepID=UPI003B5B81FB
MELKELYWQNYFAPEIVSQAQKIRTTYQVSSTGVILHVDAFEQSTSAPVLIFNHGAGGYSRLFTPLALALWKLGYTVLLPDQVGQGLSKGMRPNLSITNFVANIVDVSIWARKQHRGPIFLAGGSLGSGLTYYAAAAGAPVDALICHNLYAFGRMADVLALSSFSWATAVPGLPFLFEKSIQLLAALMPNLPIPYQLLGKFARMVDRREPDFYAKWRADPVPLRWVTPRYLRSMFTTKTAVPFRKNQLPILVINPTLDEMVDPKVTKRNFEQLSGPKTYAELPFGHWALNAEFVTQWVDVVDSWCQSVLANGM